jgi:hypothetical protein
MFQSRFRKLWTIVRVFKLTCKPTRDKIGTVFTNTDPLADQKLFFQCLSIETYLKNERTKLTNQVIHRKVCKGRPEIYFLI